MSLVLASASAARAALMTGAGLIFKRIPADVDERLIEEDLVGLSAADVAQALADVKAKPNSAFSSLNVPASMA